MMKRGVVITSQARRQLGTLSRSIIAPSPLPLRSFSSSPSLLNLSDHPSPPATPSRAPVFTTPDSPISPDPVYDSSKPLPPTDLPVEDYASPLLHTGSIFAKVFRYAVFGSVGIVVLGGGSWLLAHQWVERVELAGPKRSQEEEEADVGSWGDDAEGWSGGYLGGGTDPRLGVIARYTIRAAWMTQHWTSPTAAVSPVSRTSNPSPFSVGGSMIGASSNGPQHQQVADAGLYQAEQFLINALERASLKGISLIFRATDEAPLSPPGVDRAAVELEQRLATARERIGGRYKLEEAREGWERIFYALASSAEPSAWEKREKVRATKKLGELSARLAGLFAEDSQERLTEKVKAEGWLIGGLLPALRELGGAGTLVHTDITPLPTPPAQPETTKKSASPISSFFAFWSRSHPSSEPSIAIPSTLRPELVTLLQLLEGHTRSPPSKNQAGLNRAILNSLVSLETHLARERQLPAAQAVQKAALAYANSLHSTPGFTASPSLLSIASGRSSISQSPDADTLPWSNTSWTSPALDELFIATRTALLSTHLAEVSLALGESQAQALTSLQGAMNDCEHALKALEESPFDRTLTGLDKVSAKPFRHRFSPGAKSLLRDAKGTGAVAARLSGYVHESGCGGLATKKWRSAREDAKVKEWCGGDAIASAFYAKSLEFSPGTVEAEKGLARTRKRVLAEESVKLQQT